MNTHDLQHMPVTTLGNGHELTIPVHTLTGSSGPRLGLVSGIHGDEPLAVETVRRIVESVRDDDLAGTVVAIPVANAYAHMALTRHTPLDGVNLNRTFPGAHDGTITEQIAAKLLDLLTEQVDFLIDFHSGGVLACVDYGYLGSDKEFAKAYGPDILYAGPGYPGSLTSTLQSRGVKTLVSEFGGASARIDHYIDKGVSGARNAMRYLGLLKGNTEQTAGQRVVQTLEKVSPRHGGILLCEYGPDRLGDTVPGGTVLGRVLSPYTFEELEVITAPYEESILILTRPSYTNVSPGDYGFMLADAATASPADADH
jgi:uncharacterized protein